MLLTATIGIIVNYSIVGPFRITDLCLLVGIGLLFKDGGIKKDLFWVIITIIALLGMSLVAGLVWVRVRSIENIFFFYKFVVPFVPPILMYSIRWDTDKLKNLHRASFYAFLFLTGWVYMYMVLKLFGMTGNWRPKWPFSSEEWGSDAHLYSSYLALGLVFFRAYWRRLFEIRSVFANLLSATTIVALVLTGSRTGVVVLVGYTLIRLFGKLKIKISIRKKYIFLVPLTVILLSYTGYRLATLETDTREQLRLMETILRTFDFDVSSDQSANSRLDKFFLSFEQSAETHLIFGPGALAMKGNWYDGYIPQVNVLMGGIGVIFMLILPFAILYKHYRKALSNHKLFEFNVFATVLILYFLANLITEYFLVTRSVVPFSIFLSAISIIIYDKVDYEKSSEIQEIK
ncbi:MAG: O-antigen ligase family protein [Cyclobacteriaceae bacterium]